MARREEKKMPKLLFGLLNDQIIKSIKHISVIHFSFKRKSNKWWNLIMHSHSLRNACVAKFKTKKNRRKKLSYKIIGVPNTKLLWIIIISSRVKTYPEMILYYCVSVDDCLCFIILYQMYTMYDNKQILMCWLH